MLKLISLIVLFSLTACTYSINLIHSEGTADDVIDETASNAPTVSPTLTVPVKAL